MWKDELGNLHPGRRKAVKDQAWLAKRVKVDPDSGCHVWMGSRAGGTGYGNYSDGRGVVRSAHRLSLALHLGVDYNQIIQANHKCDNRPCVNPEHLYNGTQADNMYDRKLRNR